MESTEINSNDFLITSPRDETVKGFYAANNKNLRSLPKNLGVFPNLIVLDAEACSITKISKESFEGLSKLILLLLRGNQIEEIEGDTFEHIPAVQLITLGENRDRIQINSSFKI